MIEIALKTAAEVAASRPIADAASKARTSYAFAAMPHNPAS
jgi:hypothetical protein